jgi:hypothetical protein
MRPQHDAPDLAVIRLSRTSDGIGPVSRVTDAPRSAFLWQPALALYCREGQKLSPRLSAHPSKEPVAKELLTSALGRGGGHRASS